MELHVFNDVIDDSLHRELALARAAGDAAVWEEVGGLIVVRYDDVERLSHDARLAGLGLALFDAMGIGDGPLRRWYAQLMFTNEGPPHHRTRRLVARAFTPRAVEQHREFARNLARERLAAVVDAAEGDLVQALATVPLAVICRLLGVPDQRVADFVGYGDALSPVFGMMDADQIAAAEQAIVGLERDVAGMIDDRASERGDDLISALLDVEEEGDRLTHDETVTIVGNLIVGGHDTTSSQVGCTLLTMLRHRDLGAALRTGQAPPAAVVEETIRFEPSIDVVPRTLIEPVEIAGETRAAGTIVLLSSASASRDESVWHDPDEVVPTRFTEPDAPKLLSFGSGPHYCLGAALARMTLQEVVAEFARVEGELTAVDDLDHVEWRQVLGRSPARLRVRRAV